MKPEDLARLLWMVHESEITVASATEVYEQMRMRKKGPHALVEELGLNRVVDPAIVAGAVQTVLDDHPDLATQYRQGKTAVLQFFIGEVMRHTKGRADAGAVRAALERALKSE